MSLTAQQNTTGWLTKVPLITATFWVIKVLSTTIGETFADFLAVNVGLGPVITDLTMITVLAVALTVQLRTRRYTPWIYWLNVVLVSIVGTQITDFFTDTLGVSLYLSTAVFAVLLAAVFTVWHRQEGTLAIASVDTRRRESFYWAAILVTFALGTAAGDLATEALSLGFRNGVLLFGGLIVAVALAARFGLNRVLAFWIAYVLTRPLGASLGDLLTQDHSLGGLGLGASTTSTVFFVVIVALVVREQLLTHRYGVLSKGSGPVPGRRHDLTWAVSGAAVVLILGLGLSAVRPATVPAAGTPAGGSASAGDAVHPTTALGDVSSFTPIATDVAAKVQAGDVPGAVVRVKDLEVSWDSAEAGLKPRDPKSWHVLDGQIDAVLTSVRASTPDPAAMSAHLTTLVATLNQYDGV